MPRTQPSKKQLQNWVSQNPNAMAKFMRSQPSASAVSNTPRQRLAAIADYDDEQDDYDNGREYHDGESPGTTNLNQDAYDNEAERFKPDDDKSDPAYEDDAMDGDNDDDEASSEECDIKEIDEHYQRPTPPAQVTHTVQHTVQHNEHEAPDDDSDGEPPITEETMAAMLKQPDRSVPERLAKNKRTNASLTRRQLQITEKKWIQIRRAGIGHYVTENLDALSAKGLPKSWRYKNPTHVHNAIDKLEKQFPILAKAEDSWAAIYVLRSHASNISEDVSRRSRAQTTEGSAASASPSPTTVAAAPTPTAQHATTHKVTQHPHAHADSTGAHYEVRQKQTNIKTVDKQGKQVPSQPRKTHNKSTPETATAGRSAVNNTTVVLATPTTSNAATANEEELRRLAWITYDPKATKQEKLDAQKQLKLLTAAATADQEESSDESMTETPPQLQAPRVRAQKKTASSSKKTTKKVSPSPEDQAVFVPPKNYATGQKRIADLDTATVPSKTQLLRDTKKTKKNTKAVAPADLQDMNSIQSTIPSHLRTTRAGRTPRPSAKQREIMEEAQYQANERSRSQNAQQNRQRSKVIARDIQSSLPMDFHSN